MGIIQPSRRIAVAILVLSSAAPLPVRTIAYMNAFSWTKKELATHLLHQITKPSA
jgi:hypothetical protein